MQNTAAARLQHERRPPLREVVREDGKFPYRPNIVCPKPEKKYEAQIGLKEMEGQAARTTKVPHNVCAKWALEALASRVDSHFAHLRSPVAVMNCTLCRTSTSGAAVVDWVLTITSTNPAAPYPIHSPMPTVVAPGYPSYSPVENTAEFTGITSSPWSDVRGQMACRDQLWIPTAQQPLLPDKDAITTNAWSEAYNLSLESSPEEEEERILWPRGVCDYEYGGLGHVIGRVRCSPVPWNWDYLDWN